MFDLVINEDDPRELAVLKHIARGQDAMTLKFNELTAAISDVSTKVDAVLVLLSNATDPTAEAAAQAAIDDAAISLVGVSEKLAAAIPVTPEVLPQPETEEQR